MAPSKFKVIIVGGGIVGLSLGVMLERAGIDYLILEACNEIRPLGAAIYLGPPVLRAFEQLGLLEDITRQSNTMTGATLLDHKLNKVCRISTDHVKDRYGYATLSIVRPKLHDILLARIPAYKLLFHKRVVSMAQSAEGVKVRCEDGSAYNGDIIVAADGGASPIRTAMYEEMKNQTKKVLHPTDYAPSKSDQRCIAGVTEPLSVKQYPILASESCEVVMLMPKDSNCMIWFAPVGQERRFGWGISSPLPPMPDGSLSSNGKKSSRGSLESAYSFPGSPSIKTSGNYSAMSNTSHTPPSPSSASSNAVMYSDSHGNGGGHNLSNISTSHLSFNSLKKRHSTSRLSKRSSSSDGSSKTFQQYPTVLQTNESSTIDLADLPYDRVWGKLDEKYTIEDSLREQATPFGGTLGDLIDATSRKMISTAVVEEKFYHTWHFGRTILMGDACHKFMPSSGHGTTQGLLDAICLASLLAELPSNSITDVDAIFRVQYERRGPAAKAAVISSKKQDQLLFSRKISGKIVRKVASSWLSDWLMIKMGDRIFEARPSLPFLKTVPDRGSLKNKDNTVPLLKDKRFEVARRKSIASGYLIGGTGSYKLGGRKDDEDDMIIDTDISLSASSWLSSKNSPASSPPLPLPSMPMIRPLSGIMDIERGQSDVNVVRNNHWLK
ncbi:hypothetical protein BGZ49_007950 [Haplosporangium sp. Z 27]|nr:hypothetical protein BGZ49_007950 [Haplosporangium sp. Z 27]